MTHTPENLSVAVLAIGNALDPVASRQLREMPAGGTVRSYALAFWPLLPPEYEIGVAIDGRPVADAMALVIEPGQSLMLVVVPKGGGGGGKNILTTVAMVAFTIWGGGFGPGGMIGQWIANQAMANGLISLGMYTATALISGVAVTLAGGMLISAVMGGGAGAADQGAGGSDLTNSATYSWDAKPNPIVEGGVCPILWGTMRVTPPMIGRYITSTEDGKQTINLLYLVADHALDSITDIEINGNPSSYYTDVTIETRLGAVDQTVIENFSDTISEKQGAAVLSTSYATLRTDGNAVEGLGVSLVCDQGLYYANNSGGLDPQTITVEIEHRKVGDTDWTAWGAKTITDSVTNAVRRYYRYDNVTAGQYDIRVKLQTAPTTGPRYRNRCIFESIQEIVYDDFRYPGASLLSIKALATDQLSGGLPTITCLATRSTVPIDADSSIGLTSTNIIPDSCDYTATRSWAKSAYATITPNALLAPDGTITASLLTDTSAVSGQSGYIVNPATVCRQTIGDTRTFTSSIYVKAGTSTRVRFTTQIVTNGVAQTLTPYIDFNPVNGSVVASSGTVAHELTDSGYYRLRATATCNGLSTGGANSYVRLVVYANVNATGVGDVYIWGDQLEEGPTATTYCPSNIAYVPATSPAWACCDLMRNDEYGGGIPYARIVYDELDSWADWCTTEGHTVNLYVDEAINFQKLSQTIAICGRGRIDQIGSKFTCAVDRPITLPVQKFLFTMGNIVTDSFAEEWMSMEDRANVIEITYIDKDANYSRQVVEVRSQDFDTTTTPVNKGAYTLLGVTSRDNAVAYGNFLINSNRYLTNTVSFDVDIEALGCLPGDVVDVSHDVPQWGYSGRLVAATTSTVTLDREVLLEVGKSYALNVKLDDDTRDDVVIQGVGVETTTAILTIVGAWAGATPEKYDHYSFGETSRQSKLFRIISTIRNSDQRCKVVALEYVDEVYDDGAVIPTPEVTSDLPGIVSLRATENFEIISGIPTPRIDLTWRGAALSWKVSCRETGGVWGDCGTVYAPGKSIPGEDLNPGTGYEFMVTTGDIQSTTTIAYIGGPIPEDVTGVYAFLQSGALYLAWDSLNLPWVITYEIRKGNSWATAQTIGSTSTTLLQITGPGAYFVAAKSGTQYSATPSAITVTDEPLTENVIATWDEKDTLWTGTRTDGLYIVGDELWLLGYSDVYDVVDIYAVADIWTLGGVTPSATYTIPAAHIIDVGAESICNVQIEYSLRGDGVYADIYDEPDIYAVADIYGGYGAFVSATPEIRTYRSGAWGPWVAYNLGQYTGEKFEARITVSSSDTATIAILEEFTFSVDVPDRIDTHKGQTVPVTGLSLTHSPAFHATPTTVIQILSATAGDDDIITNETATGFDLIIHNGGSPVERTVNIISAGY